MKIQNMSKTICLCFILSILGIFCFRAVRGEPLNQETDMNGEQNNPFGVLEFLHWNQSWNNYKYPKKKSLHKVVALMKEAGVGWVRIDLLWQDIEPKQGEFEFAKYDEIVDLLAKNNINILGLLNYSADWASAGGQWNYPSKENQLFVNYAVEVVKHYKDRIKYWEIWNEPDSSTYWATQDGLKSYCRLLKDTYTAIKEVAPDSNVLNGGLANGMLSVNNLYDNGAKEYFDILNMHIFVSPLIPNAAQILNAYPKAAYKIMARKGDAHKKIWITEVGCPGVKRGLKVKNWWLERNPNERQQAEWVKKAYEELLKNKAVEKVFWAFFRDCQGHWDNGVDYFGLVRWDFSKKPAFISYQKSIKDWKKAKD